MLVELGGLKYIATCMECGKAAVVTAFVVIWWNTPPETKKKKEEKYATGKHFCWGPILGKRLTT